MHHNISGFSIYQETRKGYGAKGLHPSRTTENYALLKIIMHPSSLKSTALEVTAYCNLCDDRLLRHLREGRISWFCPSCRQDMPNFQQPAVPGEAGALWMASEAIALAVDLAVEPVEPVELEGLPVAAAVSTSSRETTLAQERIVHALPQQGKECDRNSEMVNSSNNKPPAVSTQRAYSTIN